MRFAMVGRIGPGMRLVVGSGDQSTVGGIFGGMTNREFAALRGLSQITLGNLVISQCTLSTSQQTG